MARLSEGSLFPYKKGFREIIQGSMTFCGSMNAISFLEIRTFGMMTLRSNESSEL